MVPVRSLFCSCLVSFSKVSKVSIFKASPTSPKFKKKNPIIKKITEATKKADAIATKAKIESKKPIEMKIDKKTAPDVAKKEVPNQEHDAAECQWKKFKHRSLSVIGMNIFYLQSILLNSILKRLSSYGSIEL